MSVDQFGVLVRQGRAVEPGVNPPHSTVAIEEYRRGKRGEVGELGQGGGGRLGVVGSCPKQQEGNVVRVPVQSRMSGLSVALSPLTS